MKHRIIALLLSLVLAPSLCACNQEAPVEAVPPKAQEDPTEYVPLARPSMEMDADFKVTFLDVGQGDAALVECDGEYMLIDVGTTASGEKIQKYLIGKGIYKLKYLVISHMHADHYGGIKKGALQNVTVEKILCNKDPYAEGDLGDALKGCRFIIPEVNEDPNQHQYTLGSAKIHVLDASAEKENDSLVLLIRYQDTSFLFTGDIEGERQSEVAAKLRMMSDKLEGCDNLIKMPHHGAFNSNINIPALAYDNSLNTLVTAAYATHFVISVGPNSYGHPDDNTLKIIRQCLDANELNMEDHLFRTDQDRDIVLISDGKNITSGKK